MQQVRLILTPLVPSTPQEARQLKLKLSVSSGTVPILVSKSRENNAVCEKVYWTLVQYFEFSFESFVSLSLVLGRSQRPIVQNSAVVL
jgi:hypothetical protein